MRFLSVLLVLAFALAGCTDDAGPADTGDPDPMEEPRSMEVSNETMTTEYPEWSFVSLPVLPAETTYEIPEDTRTFTWSLYGSTGGDVLVTIDGLPCGFQASSSAGNLVLQIGPSSFMGEANCDVPRPGTYTVTVTGLGSYSARASAEVGVPAA